MANRFKTALDKWLEAPPFEEDSESAARVAIRAKRVWTWCLGLSLLTMIIVFASVIALFTPYKDAYSVVSQRLSIVLMICGILASVPLVRFQTKAPILLLAIYFLAIFTRPVSCALALLVQALLADSLYERATAGTPTAEQTPAPTALNT